MNSALTGLAQRLLDGGAPCSKDEALRLASGETDLDELLYWANRLRQKTFGNKVKACGILSVRTGACSENCAFCAQSSRHKTLSPVHGFVPAEKVAEAARASKEDGVYGFAPVMSGYGPRGEEELSTLAGYLQAVRSVGGLEAHGSFGIMTEAQVERLKQAGLACCNHNLETSRRFFKNICTTHTYDERVATLKALAKHGVRICSGGLFGMGETWEDRIDLALELRELGSHNVPMNFLSRIPGTPLGDHESLPPREILRVIALYRFLLPERTIGIYGGREANLRDLQALIFTAGANALMMGNYLVTTGRSAALDRQMIQDLGLELVCGH